VGRIHILSDLVANQIAAGEVVDRPASVVKELLENAIDAGATRIRIEVEGGGRKLIRIMDNGSGMVRDDALLAFERHATSKVKTSSDLLTIASLGFRGEALPSIASISRLEMSTRAEADAAGTIVEIVGGKMHRVGEAGIPQGTMIAVRDLFFNTPARRKFLKSETTELAHVTALVTNYALAHPDKHFELHSATHALLIAPPVAELSERVYQIFGKETLDHLLPIAAEINLSHIGLPEPPPWKRDGDYVKPDPGHLRLRGFISKPELQKLNRNSMYSFVNQRLVRERVIIHAITDAYRNILPPTSFPVVLLFLEMPPGEVDVNVHPAKTEVRFRQPSLVHDFVRDSVRTKLIFARPAMSFGAALETNPLATPSLGAQIHSPPPSALAAEEASQADSDEVPVSEGAASFTLEPPQLPPVAVRLDFSPAETAAAPLETSAMDDDTATLKTLGTLKALGQLKESFILATNEEGLWIIDQHVAHERVLFEKVLRERKVESIQRQRLLMPMLIELTPAQMICFAQISTELDRNGFEAEPFGPRTLAIKAAPIGLEGRELERMLVEVLEQTEREEQSENLDAMRTRVAASIACHSAIKVNTPLDPARMEWLLAELAKTEHPTSCPHGRPIVLRYSWKEIQKAFHRI
jgi:DNA mismatch repair protein MutL